MKLWIICALVLVTTACDRGEYTTVLDEDGSGRGGRSYVDTNEPMRPVIGSEPRAPTEPPASLDATPAIKARVVEDAQRRNRGAAAVLVWSRTTALRFDLVEGESGANAEAKLVFLLSDIDPDGTVYAAVNGNPVPPLRPGEAIQVGSTSVAVLASIPGQTR